MKKYSIVVHPAELLDEIKKIKQGLKSLIGWYSSVNALAHFTICEFWADEIQLYKVKKEVSKLVATWTIRFIILDSFDAFKGGAFYIRPDEDSSLYLQELLKAVGTKVKEIIPEAYTCTTPHLSIGRRLNEEQLEVAKRTFT
ncbi:MULTISPECIES: 2'-5' RNA ligase family protein [Sphingobacterium]|uniref:2'-5' RNA ligase family protein n=1 Tax=Sphingobacterium litopenaei TaxID=2763500 RepID=A0ABR7Y9W4_9SPHI|nr:MULTISPECIES: 2'-5' RNA ligase family protein [Sphingobacterium]MBD1428023.1 2'-5' RNA ligase family protein [Sphingobacterium litopenaei]NGM72011.1 2'-5' RNA ligase family protein [Sphingobacterium sp. SGL-16]